MNFLTDYSWLVWLGLILVFLIVEMATLEFTFLMIAIGSLGGLASGLLGLPWWAQIIIAGIVALLLLLVVKPALIRRLRKGADDAKTLLDALVGMKAIALGDFENGTGQVKLAVGETWTAKLADNSKAKVVEGETLEVVQIDGATAVVTLIGKAAK